MDNAANYLLSGGATDIGACCKLVLCSPPIMAVHVSGLFQGSPSGIPLMRRAIETMVCILTGGVSHNGNGR